MENFKSENRTSSDELDSREVAQIIEDFLGHKGNRWAWDDFTLGMSFQDKRLERIQRRCAGLSQEFPAATPNEYCGEQGREIMREFVRQLRSE